MFSLKHVNGISSYAKLRGVSLIRRFLRTYFYKKKKIKLILFDRDLLLPPKKKIIDCKSGNLAVQNIKIVRRAKVIGIRLIRFGSNLFCLCFTDGFWMVLLLGRILL